jgi:hypothetical protein
MPIHVVLIIFLWAVVSVGVWVDARRNSSQRPALWALAVFLGWIPILLVYVLLGRDATDAPDAETVSQAGLIECPNCHAMEDPTSSVCQFCEEPM